MKSDQERIADLEIKIEVQRALISVLIGELPDGKSFLVALERATALHDANLPYATSLSDEQLHAVLAYLAEIAGKLRALQRP